LSEGLFAGLSIAVVTGIIWTIGFGDAPWLDLCAWWGLIGLAMHLMTRAGRNAVRIGDPLAAVALVFVGSFLVNLLPTTETFYNALGPLKTIPIAIRAMAADIQESPALPATFWINAEKKLPHRPVEIRDVTREPRSDKSGSTVTGANLENAANSQEEA